MCFADEEHVNRDRGSLNGASLPPGRSIVELLSKIPNNCALSGNFSLELTRTLFR